MLIYCVYVGVRVGVVIIPVCESRNILLANTALAVAVAVVYVSAVTE